MFQDWPSSSQPKFKVLAVLVCERHFWASYFLYSFTAKLGHQRRTRQEVFISNDLTFQQITPLGFSIQFRRQTCLLIMFCGVLTFNSQLKYVQLSFNYTVGIQKPDMSGFRMGFFMLVVLRRTSFLTSFYGLYFSHLTQYISQIACWASEGSALTILYERKFMFIYKTIEAKNVLTLKSPDFKGFRISNGRISDPDCSLLDKLRALLRALLKFY